MKNILQKNIILLFLVCITPSVFSQDLGNIGKQKPLRISGSIGANHSSTITNDTGRAPLPSSYSLNASINFDVFGFSVPLTVVLSNGQFNISNAFNQFGMSPHYKWLTLHGGYRQMNFSEFSLSGQTFLGAGIEANPGKIRLGAMVGRFAKAVEYDTVQFGKIIPGSYPLEAQYLNGQTFYNKQSSYSRLGYGLKLGYGTQDNFFDVILFKAFDKKSSLKDTLSTNRVLPEENFVLGFNTFHRIAKHFTFGVNAATSLYTYNTNADDTIPLEFDKSVKNLIEPFIKLRSTTQLQLAGSANFGVVYPNFSLQAQYRLIQPYYRSMGISTFLSDLQSITVSPTVSFLKNKIQLTNSFQTQHDNLNKYKIFTTRRNMINSTVSVNPNNIFGVDFTYSGFNLNQKKNQLKASDSTRLAQQSNTFMVMPRLMFTKQTFSDIISIATSYTNISNKVSVQDAIKTTNFYTTITNTINLAKSGWSFTTGLNYNNAKSAGIKLISSGGVAGISKAFFDNRLSVSNNNTLLFNKSNGIKIGKTFSSDLQMNFEIKKKHHFTIGGNYTESPANGIYNQSDFTLYRLDLGYQYSF
ncbi:MAG: hypothetical protein WKF91_00295 [Segetibacter sp.]